MLERQFDLPPWKLFAIFGPTSLCVYAWLFLMAIAEASGFAHKQQPQPQNQEPQLQPNLKKATAANASMQLQVK